MAATNGYYADNAYLPCCVGGGPTPVNKLATPATSTNNVGQNGFTIDWQDVVNATSYNVDIATDSGFGNIIDSATGLTASQYTTSNRLSGTNYYYRVQAIDSTGTYVASDYGTGSVQTAQGLQAPTLGTAQRSANTAQVPVTPASGADTTVVQASTDPAFGGTPLVGTVSGGLAKFTGLATGTLYYYRGYSTKSGSANSGYTANQQFTTHDTVITFTGGNPANAAGVNANTGGVANNVKSVSFNARSNRTGTPISMAVNQIPGSGLTPAQQFNITATSDYTPSGGGDNFAFTQADGKVSYDQQFINGTIN